MSRPVEWGVGVALAVTMALGLVAGFYELHDPDVWWVAAAGREELARGALPMTNLFSFTDPLHPWLMHEWLLAAPYTWLIQTLGPGGFALVALAQTVAATALLAHFFSRETRHIGAFLGLTAVTLFFFGLRFLTPRPTHVALLVALAFATLVYRARITGARAALLVALELLWTNLHGSFIVGIFIITASLLVYRDEWRLRAGAALLVTAATFVSPFGLREHRFVLDYFLGRSDIYRVIHDHVADFAPLYSLSPKDEPLAFVSFFLVVAASGLALQRSGSRARGAIIGVLALVAIKNVRHLDLAGIVSMIVIAPCVDSLFRKTPLSADVPRSNLLPLAMWAPALFLGLGAFSWRCTLLPSSVRFVTPDGTRGASWIAALEHVPSGANLYVPFSAGGVAIWFTTMRGIRVFYDPRNDCYSPEVARDAFALEGASGGVTKVVETLERYGTTEVLLPQSHPLASVLRDTRDFALSFETSELVLFTKVDAPDL